MTDNYFTFLNNKLSIRSFLTISLIMLMTVITTVSGVFYFLDAKIQNENLFKVQMVNGAKALDLLIGMVIESQPDNKFMDANYETKLKKILKDTAIEVIPNIKLPHENGSDDINKNYKNVFSYEVYSIKKHKVVLNTGGIGKVDFSSSNKFQTIMVDKNSQWYAYVMTSKYSPYKIAVLVNMKFKQDTFWSIFYSSILKLIAFYLVLIASITIIVRIALRPLEAIRYAISKKDIRNLKGISVKKAPLEVVPLLNEMNDLFSLFNKTLAREKRFSGDAAHELKTPISALKSQAEVALNINDVDEIHKKIKNIIISTDHYASIIDQLLVLSRIEPKQELPNRANININKIAEEQLVSLAKFALEKNIDLSFHSSDPVIDIFATDVLIAVMFKNIIKNAIHYTEEGGTVSVNIIKKSKIVSIIVEDNGIGVAAENLKKIFDRFYRELGSNKQGSGLGLSIVKEVVRLHDGKVFARNAKEKGLILIINLPLASGWI